MTDDREVGGTRSFLPAVEGMRACAAMGVVVTHVAFQTGHSSGVDGRLFGRFDLAVAVFFALVGISVVARACGGGAGHRHAPAYGSLPALAGGPHHAGLPGGGRGDPDPAARLGPRQPHRVVGQSDAHPDLCAADSDRRPHPDVEPVRRGQLLPGAAGAGVAGPPDSGRRPRAGDRRTRGAQLGVGLAAAGHAGRRPRRQPDGLAAGVLLVVRRGNGAGRVGAQSGRLAAPTGPPTGS